MFAPVAAFAQAAITAGRIGTGPVDVTMPEASPKFFVTVSGTASQVVFQYVSPSGISGSEVFYSLDNSLIGQQPGFSGNLTLQGYTAASGGNGGVLSPYAEPGKWTLTNVAVADTSGGYTQYNGPALQALFPSLTFTVVNKGAADITPPQVQAAFLLTPTVSIASGSLGRINMKVSDNLSGVNQLVAFAELPGSPATLTFQNTLPLSRRTSGIFGLYASIPANAEPGSYAIQYVVASDIAGNTAYTSDPLVIAKLFNNQTIIKVTQ